MNKHVSATPCFEVSIELSRDYYRSINKIEFVLTTESSPHWSRPSMVIWMFKIGLTTIEGGSPFPGIWEGSEIRGFAGFTWGIAEELRYHHELLQVTDENIRKHDAEEEEWVKVK